MRAEPGLEVQDGHVPKKSSKTKRKWNGGRSDTPAIQNSGSQLEILPPRGYLAMPTFLVVTLGREGWATAN